MLFNVARYIPLDDMGSKTELCKKLVNEQNEEDTSEDGDQDPDYDTDDLFNASEKLNLSYNYSADSLHKYSSHKYLCAYTSITTPPPKI